MSAILTSDRRRPLHGTTQPIPVHTADVTSSVLGRVFVVAGREPALAGVARELAQGGALVAFVCPARLETGAELTFRAAPEDAATWDRIAPHIEQRLGPVDGVAVDAASAAVADGVFGADLQRRGHGRVVVVDPDADAGAIITALLGTQ